MADGLPIRPSARATCPPAASTDGVHASLAEATRVPSSSRADHLRLLEPTLTTRTGATTAETSPPSAPRKA